MKIIKRILILAFIAMSLIATAQERILHTEDNGIQWYETVLGKHRGAELPNGKVIVSLDECYESIMFSRQNVNCFIASPTKLGYQTSFDCITLSGEKFALVRKSDFEGRYMGFKHCINDPQSTGLLFYDFCLLDAEGNHISEIYWFIR